MLGTTAERNKLFPDDPMRHARNVGTIAGTDCEIAFGYMRRNFNIVVEQNVLVCRVVCQLARACLCIYMHTPVA